LIANVKIFDNIKIKYDEFGCTSVRGIFDQAIKKEAEASILIRHIDPGTPDGHIGVPSF
jgi:hypothetical protein